MLNGRILGTLWLEVEALSSVFFWRQWVVFNSGLTSDDYQIAFFPQTKVALKATVRLLVSEKFSVYKDCSMMDSIFLLSFFEDA